MSAFGLPRVAPPDRCGKISVIIGKTRGGGPGTHDNFLIGITNILYKALTFQGGSEYIGIVYYFLSFVEGT